jgi:hypothetical protein
MKRELLQKLAARATNCSYGREVSIVNFGVEVEASRGKGTVQVKILFTI